MVVLEIFPQKFYRKTLREISIQTLGWFICFDGCVQTKLAPRKLDPEQIKGSRASRSNGSTKFALNYYNMKPAKFGNRERNKPSNKASNAAHQFPLKIKFCFRFSALFFHEQASIYLSRLSDANGYMIIKNKHQKSCNAHEMSIEKSHSYIRNNPRYEEFSSYHKGRLYLSCPHE